MKTNPNLQDHGQSTTSCTLHIASQSLPQNTTSTSRTLPISSRMCGPDIPRPSLGCALAVLTPMAPYPSPSSLSPSSTPNSSRASSPGAGAAPAAPFGGSIVFHGPERTSGGIATHATFTPTGGVGGEGGSSVSDFDFANYVVGIQ